MLSDDTRSKIKNITTGAFIEGTLDNCTTIRNLLCSSYPTSTTVKGDFESKAVIKKEQAEFLEKYISEKDLWVSQLPSQETYLTRGGESKVYLQPTRSGARLALSPSLC